MPAIRIVIADDHGVLRDGLRSVLAREEGLTVVGDVGTGPDAVEAVLRLRPDVVLMDVDMPGGGIEATRKIRQSDVRTRVLVLTHYQDRLRVLNMLRAGAQGYVLKTSLADDLVRAIRVIHRGETYIDPAVAGIVLEAMRDADGGEMGVQDLLTDREREVLALLADGLTAKAIAAQLGVAEKTVVGHRTRLMEKTGSRSRADLIKFAIRHGVADENR